MLKFGWYVIPLNKILEMSEGIRLKTLKGVSWSAIDSIASQGITFIVGIILARLLSPEEFGTIGVAMIFVTLFNKIVDCGFSNALIRKQDAKDIDYNTTFNFNLVLSIFLYIVCYIASPFIASYFNNYAVSGVLRWISLILIINAFAIIQRTHLVKSIDFKTQAKISLLASIISGCVGIAMAIYGCGVWSLVGQQISRQFFNTVLLWVLNNWRPRLSFSWLSFRDLFSYGGKLMLSGIIDTICNELITVVVGKIYSPATLGQYSRAKQFSSVFSSNVSTVVERVSYPVLSEFQNNEDKLLNYYKVMISNLVLVTGIGTVIIAACSKSIILILVGPKWTDAIIYLQLLAFVEITIPLKNVNLNLLQVYGRSDYILFLSIIKRIIEIGAVCIGLINIKLMLVAYSIAGIIGFLLNAYFTQKQSGYSLVAQIKDISHPLFVSLAVGVIMFSFTFIFDDIYTLLALQLLAGFISFYIISKITKLKEFYFFKEIIVSLLFKIKNTRDAK